MTDAPTSTPEVLARPVVPTLDTLLGKLLPVAPDGFVRVIDYMGNDAAIVQAARVSYGAGTKHIQEDRGLIRFLMRHRHTTPFEMAEIKFHVRVPMDTWRQWIRHRTANVNEYSTRYSVAIDSAATTDPAAWRAQATDNRQGSSGRVDAWPGAYDPHAPASIRPGVPVDALTSDTPGAYLSRREAELHRTAREVYEERLRFGVAREQARKDLPLSTYTEAYWKCDLHNLLHFLALRLDPHAQAEIRAYAEVIAHAVATWCPLTWDAFQDYRSDAVTLTRLEAAVVRALVGRDPTFATRLAIDAGWLPSTWTAYPARPGGVLPRHREREEAEAKLHGLGFEVPW